jgi:hypothetical protein
MKKPILGFILLTAVHEFFYKLVALFRGLGTVLGPSHLNAGK